MINYGKTTVPLRPRIFEPEEEKEEKEFHGGLWAWATTILFVGLSLIPGVGESVGAAFALGAGEAAVNLGIEYAEDHEISATSAVMQTALGLLPVSSAAKRAIKPVELNLVAKIPRAKGIPQLRNQVIRRSGSKNVVVEYLKNEVSINEFNELVQVFHYRVGVSARRKQLLKWFEQERTVWQRLKNKLIDKNEIAIAESKIQRLSRNIASIHAGELLAEEIENAAEGVLDVAKEQSVKKSSEWLNKKLYKLNKELELITKAVVESGEVIKQLSIENIIQVSGALGYKITGREARVLYDAMVRSNKRAFSSYIRARTRASLMVKSFELKRVASKANTYLAMANPDRALGRVADKIFDPIREGVERKLHRQMNKVYKGLSAGFKQAEKKLMSGEIIPTPQSSAILGLRVYPDPIEPGRSLVWVEFIKKRNQRTNRIYHPVKLTPSLSALSVEEFITAPSPGRHYHREYRLKYAVKNGILTNKEKSLLEFGEQLGFIPDAWISLGMSYVNNIKNFNKSLVKWGDLSDKVGEELSEKIGEVFAGELGKEIARDVREGTFDTFGGWTLSKIRELTEQRESSYRKVGKQAQGKINAVQSLKNL